MSFHTRKVLAENLSRLMRLDEPDKLSQASVGRMAGCNQRTVGRILSMQQSATVDMLEGIAKGFDLEAWQLLVPGLDPSNPPVNHITEAEKRLYERLREATRAVFLEDRKPYKTDQ